MKVDEFLDITDVVCPMTFVKNKVALEDLDDRHKILELANNADGTFTILVKKGGLT